MTVSALKFVSSSQAVSDQLNREPEIFQRTYADAVQLVDSKLATYSIYAVSNLTSTHAKQKRAASLISSWLADPTDHDDNVYPALQEELKNGTMRCREG